jgi:hypothetical protein
VCDTEEKRRNAIAGANAQNEKKATTKPLKMTARSCNRGRQQRQTGIEGNVLEKNTFRSEKTEQARLWGICRRICRPEK